MDPNSRALFFGGGGANSIQPFGTAAQNGTIHSSGGRIVLDGYGLLFYIGSNGLFNTWGDYGAQDAAARSFTLSNVTGVPLDITLIGGGGACTGGGGGGGGGGAGVRLVYTPTGNITLIVGGGMNTHYSSTQYGTEADLDPGQSKLKQGGTTIAWAGGGGGSATASATYSVQTANAVYASTGQNSSGSFSMSTGGSFFSTITAIDTNYQIDRGGNGQFLNGFGSTLAGNGAGLGGGGGGQNSFAYGGSSGAGSGGRYGYSGSVANPNTSGTGYNASIAQAGTMYGYGPSPGESNAHRNVSSQGTYNNGGGGGSFGGGGGDDGSSGSNFGCGGTGAGGAILVRVDTSLGFFISGRNGWPTSTGPWTG